MAQAGKKKPVSGKVETISGKVLANIGQERAEAPIDFAKDPLFGRPACLGCASMGGIISEDSCCDLGYFSKVCLLSDRLSKSTLQVRLGSCLQAIKAEIGGILEVME